MCSLRSKWCALSFKTWLAGTLCAVTSKSKSATRWRSLWSQIQLFWLKKSWRQHTSFLRHSAGWCHPFQVLNCSQFQPSSNSVQFDYPVCASIKLEPSRFSLIFLTPQRTLKLCVTRRTYEMELFVHSVLHIQSFNKQLKHDLQLSKAFFCSLWDLGTLCSVLWTP